ncbi:amino acid ABC transporter substrate-binding protein [Pseudoalteromonas sp. S1727]|nr:amino acid ABC transporter substrate-binding protein [Pseudoalteromonas sp. S1727]
MLYLTAVQAKATELIYCYEDTRSASHFLNEGSDVPIDDPDALLAVFQRLDNKLDQVSIRYVRQPWQACLTDLRSNKVNAVIAAYRKDRTSFGQYPLSKTQQPDSKRAVSEFSSCLIGSNRFHQQWQSREVFQTKAFTLALPRGYKLNKAMTQEPFFIQHTASVEKALELIERGVADASIKLCQIGSRKIVSKNQNTALKMVYPPITKEHGYLVFSKTFYDENQSLSQRIWHTLAAQDNAKLYVEQLSKAGNTNQLASTDRY